MQAIDRAEFDRRMEVLCAAYNVPVSVRPEAYWNGLQRMSIVEFSRLVEWALSEDSPHPEKIPTVGQFWAMKRDIHKRRAAAESADGSQPKADTRDHLEYYATRLLIAHITGRGGLGSTGTFVPGHGIVDPASSSELLNCLGEKRDLVNWFLGLIQERDPDATPRAFIRAFIKAMQRCGEIAPATLQKLNEDADAPQSAHPFQPSMARELNLTRASA